MNYTAWRHDKVAKSLANPHPALAHDEVMAEMETVFIFIVNPLKLLYDLKNVFVVYATTKRGLENPKF
ncbi:hypothetical protein [Bartonella doshiae]|uniref:antitoxin PaaA2 family protein n=1 Tax=Bartonella doshiae TaxID=33044 RepID=UPI003138C93A